LAYANVTTTGIEYFGIFNAPNSTYDEDCLYANVWTKPQTGEKKKAVLVWIYGGAFTSGSSANTGYNGANLAEQEDIIVVSFK
jgi:carboxylesterase type B